MRGQENGRQLFFGQVLRYQIAAAVGTFTYYVTLFLLTERMGVWYVLSAVVGSTLSFITNFVSKKLWAFQNNRLETVRRELKQYFLLTAVMSLGNIVSLFLMVRYLGLQYLVAQIVLSCITMPLSFWVARKIFII